MEFQVRREGLPVELKGSAADSERLLGLLWRYLTTEWLRLAIPSGTDETRSRWPIHPLWEALAGIFDVPPDAPPLVRVTKSRAPSDHAIFKAGLWGLTSFMGREGLTRVDEGLGQFLHALEAYHDGPNAADRQNLESYLSRKARAKARRYNVRIEDNDEG